MSTANSFYVFRYECLQRKKANNMTRVTQLIICVVELLISVVNESFVVEKIVIMALAEENFQRKKSLQKPLKWVFVVKIVG